MAYNVLSLDGGGIRGIISVVVLERLSREPSIAGFLDRVGLLADGGVFAPNPSMCALAQTQDARTGENVPLADVRLLSSAPARPCSASSCFARPFPASSARERIGADV